MVRYKGVWDEVRTDARVGKGSLQDACQEEVVQGDGNALVNERAWIKSGCEARAREKRHLVIFRGSVGANVRRGSE